MPVLNWIGKEKIVTHHNDVPYHVLKRTYSFDEDGKHDADNGSENMIIHGDNLIALKALLPAYEGRVSCIYIDPPYNTGEEKWVYNDNVNDPRILKWLNNVVGKEGEDLSRHDKWLCMMYPRLQILRKLLSDDGAIFISIDKNEVCSLKAICDEIFGLNCYVNTIGWQRVYCPRNDSKGIPNELDSILVYSKNPKWEPIRLPRNESMDNKYSSPDNDPIPWTSAPAHAPGASSHTGMVYAIQHPITGELIYPADKRHWNYGQEIMFEILSGWNEYELRDINDFERRVQVCGNVEKVPETIPAIMLKDSSQESLNNSLKRYKQGNWPSLYFTSKGFGGMRLKKHLDSVSDRVVTNLWPYSEVGHTDEATKELKQIFGQSPFETPKPTRLIERIIHVANLKNGIILDSFAGSGSTAHAVLEMNKRDGGNRKFICIELMDYAETITAERIKRVITGYSGSKDEETIIFDKELDVEDLSNGKDLLQKAKTARKEAKESGEYDSVAAPKLVDNHLVVTAKIKGSDEIKGTGGNFSFYELGEAVVGDEGFNPSLTEEEIKAYVWLTETRTKYVRPEDDSDGFLGILNGQAIYLFHDEEGGEVFNRSTLCRMKHRADNYVVYADACTFSEEELDRMNIVFRKIPRDVIAK